jgi:hypothetical protein
MRRGLLSGQRPVAVGIVFHLSDPFSAHPRQVAIPRWGFPGRLARRWSTSLPQPESGRLASQDSCRSWCP